LLGGPDQDPDDIVRAHWAGNRLRDAQINTCVQPFDGQRPRIHSVQHTEIQSIVDQATKLVPTGVYPVRVHWHTILSNAVILSNERLFSEPQPAPLLSYGMPRYL
jgi:hypothetical protein